MAKLLSAVLVAVTAVVCMSYNFAGHKNVSAMQDNCTILLPADQQVYCGNSTLYDFNFQAGPFSDLVDAKQYKFLLTNCDAECQTIGTRWSYIYDISGTAMLTFLIQSIILAVGVWIYPLRLVAIFL